MQCPSPISIKDPRRNLASIRISVPCGKCGACRHNRRADWSFRLNQELKDSDSCFFITLTYNDETLPIIPSTGEITLRKSDFQNFLKRLRKRQAQLQDQKIRYYAVGEYGTNTDRPHYHAIIFNLVPQLIDHLDEIWQNGHTHVGSVTHHSIHYVTKYHLTPRHETNTDRQPEFALMSRRPGIGHNYIKRAEKWHTENGFLHVKNGKFTQRMPQYYKEKIFDEIERKLLSSKQQDHLDREYWREFDRLTHMAVHDPDHKIFENDVNRARLVTHKSTEKNDLF